MSNACTASRIKSLTVALLTLIGYNFGAVQMLYAEETRLVIRALADDAKFIGTGMSGMEVLIKDAGTGELLDRGVTRGSTGETNRILSGPETRYAPISSEGAASYKTSLDLSAPRRIEVTVRGPIGQPQVRAAASSTQWVIPGKHIEQGDGWLINVPGLVVDVTSPSAHVFLERNVKQVQIQAAVMMLCGCGISPDGRWDANFIDVEAVIQKDDTIVSRLPLQYAGQTSQFSAIFKDPKPGTYEVIVSAFDPRTGNGGVDRTSFIVK